MSDEGLEPYGTVADQPAGARRRSRLIGATAIVVVAGIGGGFAAGWASRSTPHTATSVASPGGIGAPSVAGGEVGASATTMVTPAGGVAARGGGTVWASPVGVAGGTSVGQKVTSLGRRTTLDGIAVRAYRNSFTGPGSLPAQCSPTGSLIVELSDTDAVFETDVPLYPEAAQKAKVMGSGLWGLVEGAPAAWAVIATAPGIDKVSVSFDGGGTDVVRPVGGVAVVASRLKTEPAGGLTGTVLASGSGGTTTLPLLLRETPEPMMTAPGCLPVPPATVPNTVPSLPPAGTQPSDPAAARAAVTKAIGIVFGGVAVPDPFEYVQGATASLKAAQKTAADNNPTAHTTTVVQQIVFTSPTTGAVRYQLLDNGSPVLDPISQVVLDAGTWKVTAASACAAYALGGGHC